MSLKYYQLLSLVTEVFNDDETSIATINMNLTQYEYV